MDVLRAVECAQAEPGVLFWPNRPLRVPLPAPWPEETHAPLVEDRDMGPAVYVRVEESGEVRVRGVLYEAEQAPIESGEGPVQILPHPRAPWGSCRTVIRIARERARPVEFAYAPEAARYPESAAILSVPPEVLAEDVFRLVLHLRAQGVEGFDFE